MRSTGWAAARLVAACALAAALWHLGDRVDASVHASLDAAAAARDAQPLDEPCLAATAG